MIILNNQVPCHRKKDPSRVCLTNKNKVKTDGPQKQKVESLKRVFHDNQRGINIRLLFFHPINFSYTIFGF